MNAYCAEILLVTNAALPFVCAQGRLTQCDIWGLSFFLGCKILFGGWFVNDNILQLTLIHAIKKYSHIELVEM
ncbi:MAG: hypothetical protein CVU11_13770 [Bacteroidetes bacterium HGW-Bacteroidetes-6]|jgi:hypothetical protein|nr:MAG: hypothetical protein CVU11_13770 [Bacteroidetes bacterium HGW-Bacteroidetes-6]